MNTNFLKNLFYAFSLSVGLTLGFKYFSNEFSNLNKSTSKNAVIDKNVLKIEKDLNFKNLESLILNNSNNDFSNWKKDFFNDFSTLQDSTPNDSVDILLKKSDNKISIDGNPLFYFINYSNLILKNLNNDIVYPKKPFVDTEKPNAIVVIPKYDPNGFFRSIFDILFNYELDKNYDVNRSVISKPSEIWPLIDKTPNTKLLVLGGHGDGDRIYFDLDVKQLDFLSLNLEVYSIKTKFFSEKFNKYQDSMKNVVLNEMYGLKIKNSLGGHNFYLKKYLQKLDSDAVIFLNSCSAAKHNLAESISSAGYPRKVIGSTKPFGCGFWGEERKIISYYPFDAKFYLTQKDTLKTLFQDKIITNFKKTREKGYIDATYNNHANLKENKKYKPAVLSSSDSTLVN